MRTGNELHAAVLERCIFKGKPEPDTGLRLRIDERRILVTGHFPANARRFENIHRLDDAGIRVAQALNGCRQYLGARERVKNRVEIMHRVTYLVEALVFRLPQMAGVIKCVIFEEKTNLVARVVEVLIIQLRLLRR